MITEVERLLLNMFRIGTVSDVDVENRLCRVIFDSGVTSGWMKVLENHPYIHAAMAFNGSEFSRTATYSTTDRNLGYSGESFDADLPDAITLSQAYGYDMLCSECDAGTEEAAHEAYFEIHPWLPKINQKVLTVTLPVFNGDGFVLGGVTA